MTIVLNGKGLLLEGLNTKIEDKQVPGIYTVDSNGKGNTQNKNTGE